MSQRVHASMRRQRGIAAVELALIAPVLMCMLVLPLYLGRILWHYTVAQKAAHDAARYLASASAEDMRNATRANYVSAMAKSIAEAELADFNPGQQAPGVNTLCGLTECLGGAVPTTVTVGVQFQMDDIFFPYATAYYGFSSPYLIVSVTFPFVGI